MENTLYYGDNLDVLRRHINVESVDLVYLDPPFKSNQDYNVLFAEKSGTGAAAQIKAFEDTWHWDQRAEAAYVEIVETGGKVSEAVQAFRLLLGTSDMMAYLAMMAPRLVELHRVLKPTGSIWLHCDPTASHYLRVLMDSIYGVKNFRNEVVWERSSTRSSISKRFRRAHDVLLFYSKTDRYTFIMQYKPLSGASMALYENEDAKGKYQGVPLLVSGRRNGTTGSVWHGIDPNRRGKDGMHWITKPSNLDEYEKQGLVLWPGKADGVPRLKYYLDGNPGVPLNDVWYDIDLIASSAKESLGYPTQKPESLLERIITATSNKGDAILDPFCGCGTAITVAQRLDRRWIGIDVTHLAINLIKTRLHDAHGDKAAYRVIGEPTTVDDAEELAQSDPYQFQWWALGLVGARPAEQKKGADKGIDGQIYFHDDSSGKTKQVILSVKAGHTSVPHVRDLRGVIDREKAAIGVLITFQPSTQPMRTESASAGFYDSPGWGKKYPRLQIFTVGELLEGRTIDMPPLHQVNRTFKRAPRATTAGGTQAQLSLVAESSGEYEPDE